MHPGPVNQGIEISEDVYNSANSVILDQVANGVAMRMAILMHEYAHFYVNKVPSDESEADINGLKIYFTRGYPKISAYNVFLNVFKRSPSSANKERYDMLDNFIREYKEKENE